MDYTLCAVYIDLENIPARINIKRLMEEIVLKNQSVNNNETVFAVKMACGNKETIVNFESKLSEYNFDIRNVIKITKKYKNRSDLIISLEAFETLYINKPEIEKYIFITSDSDFTVIMEKLRKHGKQVWLITNTEASQKPIFNNVCNEIIPYINFLEEHNISIKNNNNDSIENNLDSISKKDDNNVEINESESEEIDYDQKAIETFNRVLETLEKEKWYYHSTIVPKMKQIYKSFDIKSTSFEKIGTFVNHFAEQNIVEIDNKEYSTLGAVNLKFRLL